MENELPTTLSTMILAQGTRSGPGSGLDGPSRVVDLARTENEDLGFPVYR